MGGGSNLPPPKKLPSKSPRLLRLKCSGNIQQGSSFAKLQARRLQLIILASFKPFKSNFWELLEY